MIYRFKCQATADLVLLGPQGDALLRLLGRDPVAQGIIDKDALPGAIAVLEAAVDRAGTTHADGGERNEPSRALADDPGLDVGERQRLWPVIQMLRRAQAADSPVVWGV
jgi:hypothetical protein